MKSREFNVYIPGDFYSGRTVDRLLDVSDCRFSFDKWLTEGSQYHYCGTVVIRVEALNEVAATASAMTWLNAVFTRWAVSSYSVTVREVIEAECV